MIAVVMSVYAGDKLEYLIEALESLYGQLYNNFDIFIQIDGKVHSKIESYLDCEFNNKRIFFLNKRQKNKGLAYSLNEILKFVLARDYRYIARMDADDICEPNRFLEQFYFMEENITCDVVGSNIIEFYEDGLEKLVTYGTSNENIKADFSTRTAIPHVSAFFRKSFFDKSGVYNINSNRNEDLWLWLNGFLNGCIFASIPSVLVKVRMSSNLLRRRGDFIHNLDTFRLRNRIVFLLKFNKVYFLYNTLVLFIKMMPLWLLRIIYKLR
jgi:glycosyltransferase involved in cell wall biosynthesis